MVSAQVTSLTKINGPKTNGKSLLLMDPPDVLSEHSDFDFDFSDVFGPIPTKDPAHIPPLNAEVYDDPAVILKRSHSLVGPTARVSQSLRLSKLTLHDSGSSLELIGEEERADACNLEDVKPERDESVGLNDFDVLKVVGQGAFGKVFQVMKKGTSEIYAMKVVRKDKIMEKNHAGYMKAERDIMTKIDHPFIVRLRYSFQTKYRFYLVLDFVNGGHLFFQLYRHGLFREDLARVYAAEIVSAVSHLHANGIMHRDLKPENILLDADGHAMLTDFGLAKQFEGDGRSNSMCGTVEYMAPEIIAKNGHDKSADWWSIGILLYEMLTGKPPFTGGSREKIQKKIQKDRMKLPTYLTSEAHSLLKGLLQKESCKRLGSGPSGSDDVRNHRWFASINWRKLEARQIKPSFRPSVAGKECVNNFDERWTSMPLIDSPVSSPVAGDCNFTDFSYARPTSLM